MFKEMQQILTTMHARLDQNVGNQSCNHANNSQSETGES